jgi:hypothetical protein
MTLLVRIASALLHASLVLYPARYRSEYGEERACILQLALEEAATGGPLRLMQFCIREWRDLPLSLIREHIREWRLRMESNDTDLQNIHEPGYTLWVGIFPFVLLGIMALAFEFPREWGSGELFRTIGGVLMFGGYLVILIGLLFGALAGFPRWSFPYLIYSVVFALYISNASTPGLVVFNIEMWGRELWGWRAWVPLGVVIILVPILNRHPWKLLKSLWNGVANNWSHLTFGLYGLLPLFILIGLDEMDNAYSFPAAVGGVVFILIGAIFYLRLKSRFWRTFSLFAFAFLSILAIMATSNLYWNTYSVNFTTGERRLLEGPVPYGSILAEAIKNAFIATLFLLLPGVIKLLGSIEHFAQGVIKRLQQSG